MFSKSLSPQVVPVEHQQIESAGDCNVIVRAIMQKFKIRRSIFARTNDFRIDNRGTVQPTGLHAYERVAGGPVSTVHRVETHASIANMDLQAIAVVLQLMRPAWPARWPLCETEGRQNGIKAAGALRGLPRELRERDNMLGDIGSLTER